MLLCGKPYKLADGWADEFPPGEVRDFGRLGFRQNLGDNPAIVRYTNFAMLECLPDQLARPAMQFPDGNRFHVSQCVTVQARLSMPCRVPTYEHTSPARLAGTIRIPPGSSFVKRLCRSFLRCMICFHLPAPGCGVINSAAGAHPAAAGPENVQSYRVDSGGGLCPSLRVVL